MIKHYDYQRYNKYFNQGYLKDRRNLIYIYVFCKACFVVAFFHVENVYMDGYSSFFVILFFLYLVHCVKYIFFEKRDIYQFFPVDKKIAIRTSVSKYKYLDKIQEVVFCDRKSYLVDLFSFKGAYKKILIINDGQKYFIPYNDEYKDELIELLSMYQKHGRLDSDSTT
ncbi:hypothetical protein [Moraxella oculi]|uniref:YcxB-like protein domain-containing protein n=1 Tax=Moraxella oculi TaxID=2940516 RepID=A0ABW8U841_9GAMM